MQKPSGKNQTAQILTLNHMPPQVYAVAMLCICSNQSFTYFLFKITLCWIKHMPHFLVILLGWINQVGRTKQTVLHFAFESILMNKIFSGNFLAWSLWLHTLPSRLWCERLISNWFGIFCITFILLENLWPVGRVISVDIVQSFFPNERVASSAESHSVGIKLSPPAVSVVAGGGVSDCWVVEMNVGYEVSVWWSHGPSPLVDLNWQITHLTVDLFVTGNSCFHIQM